MKYIFIFLTSFVASYGFSQVPIDTVNTEDGRMVIFSDKTWKYIDLEEMEEHFDGILNQDIENAVHKDLSLNYKQPWSNDVCFPSGLSNNVSNFNDTLWLCLLSDEKSTFVPPVKGIMTSKYSWRKGRYHKGVDLDLETGDTVVAAFDGVVRYAKWNEGGYGYLVIIRHYNGLETLYAHLSKVIAQPNQEIKAGTPIGLGGNTGHSYGSHLHFEVRFYDNPINPEEIIDFAKKELKDENLLLHKRLFMPGARPTDQLTSAEAVAAVNAPAVAARRYYKVRSGDTLSQIAVRNNTTVSSICRLNGIRPTTLLQIGRQLRVR
jgi:LysM repeat protein